MPAISASAPGKIILFGEHAVVYGYPAIAFPVNKVKATAVIQARPGQKGIQILAPDISLNDSLKDLPLNDAIAKAIHLTLNEIGVESPPPFRLKISSTIPLASGMGSSAAVSVVVIRAVSEFLGQSMPDEMVSKIAFEIEKIHHGTPSGIDNTVITYNQPVYFIKDQPIKTFNVKSPLTIVIGDTGSSSSTAAAVEEVRKGYEENPLKFEALFNGCGQIVKGAMFAIDDFRNSVLGPLMNDNHKLLVDMGVSSPKLNQLVIAARDAGALGAKMSGGGKGGNIVALVPPERAYKIAAALLEAGASNTIITEVKP